jgi:colanic acid/amylovoran biosynthesis glycosyltransferase
VKAVGIFSLDVQDLGDGRVELTRKFVDGLSLMTRLWPGRFTAVMAPRTKGDTNLDQQPYERAALPFDLVILDPRDPAIADVVKDAAVAMIGVDYRNPTSARACKELGVPYVLVAEYNLKTRLQIAAVEEERVEKRVKRMVWELAQEAIQRRVITDASGIQCNGTPTYEGWGPLNRDPILYFDTRVTPDMLATEDDVARRGKDDVLHLAFSGRLIPMKGVVHLVDVADHLREMKVPFQMHIWGGGSEEPKLRERIAEERLGDLVHVEGVVPFHELMAKVRSQIDLFVCPHVQGDPSCTYLETLSCGVPIAGFDNDAWRGLVRVSEAGWSAPLGDTRALADVVARLHKNRERLRITAAQALRFAGRHTFDVTFARRIEHLVKIAARG